MFSRWLVSTVSPVFVLLLRDLMEFERGCGDCGSMGGGGSWIIARSAVQLADPTLTNGSLLTSIRSGPQKPLTRLADMTGPTGEGLPSLKRDLDGWRDIQVPRYPTLRELRKGSSPLLNRIGLRNQGSKTSCSHKEREPTSDNAGSIH